MRQLYSFTSKSENNMESDSNYRHRRGNKALFGVLIVLAGVVVLIKKLGMVPEIHFHDVWPFFLIAIGIYTGIQKKFQNNAWWILIMIGVIFLIPSFSFMVGDERVTSGDLVAPAVLIFGGLIMMFKPRKKKYCMDRHQITTNT